LMLPLLLTLVHEHGQEISRLSSPSEVHGAHIRKSDGSSPSTLSRLLCITL
jgi:hypothetical protein